MLLFLDLTNVAILGSVSEKDIYEVNYQGGSSPMTGRGS